MLSSFCLIINISLWSLSKILKSPGLGISSALKTNIHDFKKIFSNLEEATSKFKLEEVKELLIDIKEKYDKSSWYCRLERCW